MAFTKKEKQEMVANYEALLEKSEGVFMLTYSGMTNKAIEALHRGVRDSGGESHVVKNTLIKIAMVNQGYAVEEQLTGTTMVGYAFSDPAATAKVLADAVKESEGKMDFKLGYLDKNELSSDEVKALAKLPPLPVMRATILGTILAPASQLVRVINEPGAQLARVIKARSEQEEA